MRIYYGSISPAVQRINLKEQIQIFIQDIVYIGTGQTGQNKISSKEGKINIEPGRSAKTKLVHEKAKLILGKYFAFYSMTLMCFAHGLLWIIMSVSYIGIAKLLIVGVQVYIWKTRHRFIKLCKYLRKSPTNIKILRN